MNIDKHIEDFNRIHEEYFREAFQLGTRFSTQGEEGILVCLLRNDRDMLSGELMEKTGLTTGRIANILKVLEKKQLILRLRDEKDKRKVHVRLTDTGFQKAARLQAQIQAERKGLLSWLGEEDGSEWVRITGRCLQYTRESLSK